MESGENRNILVISGGDPSSNSPKILIDIISSLTTLNSNADLLLKYPFYHPNINTLHLFSSLQRILHSSIEDVKRLAFKIAIFFKLKKLPLEINKYYFFPFDESVEPIKFKFFENSIKNKYDVIIVFFWQGIINSKTVEKLFDTYNVPIIFMAADMYPITGGCSYFWDCRKFENGCKFCSASEELKFRHNVEIAFKLKETRINKVRHTFASNSWVLSHAKKSGIFKDFSFILPPINDEIFKPLDRFKLKEEIQLQDKFVLFVGSVSNSDERKGLKLLIDSLSYLSQKFPKLITEIVLIVAGTVNNENDLKAKDLKCEIQFVGYLSELNLVKFYNIADVFLSPTIQDGGPLMVNQSLMCGTPVVAFEIGVAIDLITSDTGYLANYMDVQDFTNGILKILNLNRDQYGEMRKKCREFALSMTSYSVFSSHIDGICKKLSVD